MFFIHIPRKSQANRPDIVCHIGNGFDAEQNLGEKRRKHALFNPARHNEGNPRFILPDEQSTCFFRISHPVTAAGGNFEDALFHQFLKCQMHCLPAALQCFHKRTDRRQKRICRNIGNHNMPQNDLLDFINPFFHLQLPPALSREQGRKPPVSTVTFSFSRRKHPEIR